MDKKNVLKGFTLVELTFVIAIIGGILSVIMGSLPVVMEYYKTIETDKKIEEIKAGIIGFVAKNGFLPNQTEYASITPNIRDGWDNPILYSFSTRLIADDVCFRGSTEKSITGTHTVSDVAFILQSKGKNLNSQMVISNDISNTISVGTIVDNDNSDGVTPKEFDDRLSWMTLTELRTLSGCKDHPLRITTNEMPYGFVGMNYSAKVFATDGIKYSDNTYTWCILSSDLPDGLLIANASIAASYNTCTWTRGDVISFTGVPTEYGSFNMNVYVRDDNDQAGNNDNQAFKNLTITIHPEQADSNLSSNGLSFSDDLGSLNNVENKPGLITTDPANNSLQMINSNYYSAVCTWFDTAIPFRNTTIRAYFNFQFTLTETNVNEAQHYADGYTFSLIDSALGKTVCGTTGEYMAYGGIVGKSYATEIDVYRNTNHTDPNGNHISFLKNGSVDHINNTLSGNCNTNSNSNGCKYWSSGDRIHFEDGSAHEYRVEIINGYSNSSCTTLVENGNYTKMKVFLDRSGLKNNLETDSTETPDIIYCDRTNNDLTNVLVGFTASSGGGNQDVIIKDFNLKYFTNTTTTEPVSPFSIVRTVQSSWGTGRCETVAVNSTGPTMQNWSVEIVFPANETINDTWNAARSGTTGTVTFNNTAAWNQASSSDPGEFGFCVQF